MKKLSAIILVVVLMLSSIGIYAASEYEGFSYSGEKITGYSGDELDLFVPSELDSQKITAIGKDAFKNSDLVAVTVDEGIKTLEEGAFMNSQLTFVILPSTLTSIGKNAFKGCGDLSVIIFDSETCTLGAGSLSGLGSEELTVSVPCTADSYNWYAAIKAAKGDENFCIEYEHDLVDTGLKDASGKAIEKCSRCGAYTGDPVADIPFTDVSKDSWYYQYVSIAYSYSIINGLNATTFAPDNNMTRAEAIKIAATIHATQTGIMAPEELLEMSKVSDVWYEPYEGYCLDNDIIGADSEFLDDDFNWNKPATRGEMAYIFSRADTGTQEINNVSYALIPDVNAGTKYAAEILQLYKRGVAIGSTSPKYAYNPNDNVKRSEVATFITRMLLPDYRVKI